MAAEGTERAGIGVGGDAAIAEAGVGHLWQLLQLRDEGGRAVLRMAQHVHLVRIIIGHGGVAWVEEGGGGGWRGHCWRRCAGEAGGRRLRQPRRFSGGGGGGETW